MCQTTTCGVPVDQHAADCPFCAEEKCATEHCEFTDIAGTIRGKRYCETCFDGWTEYLAEESMPDHWGYRDPSPEQIAGEVFQDRLDMYRNEY